MNRLMKRHKERKISYFAAHITTIVSVTLVLIIVGVIAMISVCGASVGRQVKEQIELNVILNDSVSNEQASAYHDKIKSNRYVNTITYISKEEAMQNWTRDTGENLEEIFGVNPLSPEIASPLSLSNTLLYFAFGINLPPLFFFHFIHYQSQSLCSIPMSLKPYIYHESA